MLQQETATVRLCKSGSGGFMDKIAVTGAFGRLGSELVRRGCVPIYANVTDFYELNREILTINPDVVIHCAAKTNVDACETQAMEAMKVNAGGVYGLGQVYTGKIVYISTDYVFDGENGPYYEDDKPNPKSIYGWSKLGGEIALKNRGNPNDLIIRTTVLFDKDSRNFVTEIIHKLLNGETVEAPASLVGTPTYIPHLVDGILEAIDKDFRGILNIAGSETLSRWRLANQIAHILGVPKELVKPGAVYGRAPRPLDAGLKTRNAAMLGVTIRHYSDGVKEIINALEKMETG